MFDIKRSCFVPLNYSSNNNGDVNAGTVGHCCAGTFHPSIGVKEIRGDCLTDMTTPPFLYHTTQPHKAKVKQNKPCIQSGGVPKYLAYIGWIRIHDIHANTGISPEETLSIRQIVNTSYESSRPTGTGFRTRDGSTEYGKLIESLGESERHSLDLDRGGDGAKTGRGFSTKTSAGEFHIILNLEKWDIPTQRKKLLTM